jgi:hypothetical protein
LPKIKGFIIARRRAPERISKVILVGGNIISGAEEIRAISDAEIRDECGFTFRIYVSFFRYYYERPRAGEAPFYGFIADGELALHERASDRKRSKSEDAILPVDLAGRIRRAASSERLLRARARALTTANFSSSR